MYQRECNKPEKKKHYLKNLKKQLLNVASLKRTIQRVRQTELTAPSNLVDFNFNIPEKLKLTTDGELFLQYDNGSNDS